MKLIGAISSLSILFPFIVGLINFHVLKKELKIFFFLTIFGVVTEATLNIYSYNHINNLFIHNLWILIEYILITIVFYNWMHNKIIRALILFSIGAFLIVWIGVTVKYSISALNTISTVMERIFLFVVSGVYLFLLMKNTDRHPFNLASFWIASGVFIYFTSTTIMFAMFAYLVLTPNKEFAMYYAIIHSAINIIGNLLYTKGFLCKE